MDEAIVVKIGGSILEKPESYLTIVEKLKAEYLVSSKNLLIVVSAAKGVTDKLIQVCQGDKKSGEYVISFYNEFLNLIGGRNSSKFAQLLNELELLLNNGKCEDEATKELVLTFGERLSKEALSIALRNEIDNVITLDALKVVKAYRYLDSVLIDESATRENLERLISSDWHSKKVMLIEGFIASTHSDIPITLGRGGSDYSATAIAKALGIREVHLVSDVPGIMTADPKVVPSAKVVRKLSINEAKVASMFGVKRLHPRTFEPLLKGDVMMSVRVKSFGSDGTVIDSKGSGKNGEVKVISYRNGGNFSQVALIGEEIDKEKDNIRRLIDRYIPIALELKAFNHALTFEVNNQNFALNIIRFLHNILIEKNGEKSG